MSTEQTREQLNNRECKKLYGNSLVIFLLLCGLFSTIHQTILVIVSGFAILIFSVGLLCLNKKNGAFKNSGIWILLYVLMMTVLSSSGTIVLGFGYGFVLYGIMTIPTVFYFVYQYQNSEKRMYYALLIALLVCLCEVVSCMVCCRYMQTLFSYLEHAEHFMCFNLIVSFWSVTFYTYQFIKEIKGKTQKLEEKNKELDFRANYDPLTKLYNRSLFIEQTKLLLKLYEDTEFYMICTDIKDFKLINDLYGNDVGDKVLKMEAGIIRAIATDMSVYGRIGSDKFAICIPVKNYEEALFLKGIERMRRIFKDSNYHLYIYLGIYKIIDKNEKIPVLCDKANLALRSIKGDYEKVIAYYDSKMLEQELSQRQIVDEFENAIDNNEFCIYLQPQTHQDGYVCGAEALVRWKHPSKGLIMPGNFIECFETAGLIYKLDVYVWEKAAQKLKEWKEKGREDLHISVNISAKDFYYIDVYQAITQLVSKYQIKKENLRLEITETALAINFEENMNVLEQLHEGGFIIEIDDFGSGYSSLNLLKDVYADILKIDREFLRETQNEKTKKILEGIIALSDKMNMDVITEGVETRDQLDMLTQMGCTLFQGYYFSKPIPAEQFDEKYVRERKPVSV